jgi:hypothetical protein
VAAELWVTTAEEYRADSSLSQSKIKDYLKDPQQFYRLHVARTEPHKPPTKAMQFGTDVERLAFYGQLDAIVIPQEVLNGQGHRKGAPWTAWEAQQRAIHGPEMKLLKAEEYAEVCGPIMQAVDGLRSHDYANRLIFGEDTVRHIRMRWVDEITGLPCKCELDLLTLQNVLGDLKTCRDVSMTGFSRQVLSLGYYIQQLFYRDALRECARFIDQQPDNDLSRRLRPVLERIRDGEETLCCWVAVKNQPSYHAEVHPVDPDWYFLAEAVVRQAMAEIKQGYDTGRWQTRTHGQITTMKCPKYAGNVLDELLAATEE